MSELKNTFFSDKNKNILYNYVRREVYNESKYDLSNEKKYQKIFNKLCEKVYSASSNSPNINLNFLNNTVIQKTTPYFKDLISKANRVYTKNKNSDNLIRQLESNQNKVMERPSQNISNTSVTDQFNKLAESRKIITPSASNDMFSDRNTNELNNGNTNQSYSELLNQRRGLPKNINDVSTNSNNLTLSYDNVDLSNLSMSNITDDLSTNIDMNKSPMELYQSQTSQRDQDTKLYRSYYDDQKSFEEHATLAEKKEEEILSKRNENIQKTDLKFQSNMTNNIQNLPDPKFFMDSQFQDISIKVPTSPPRQEMTNLVPIENPNYDMLKKEVFGKRDYIERTNFISINSRDRNWANNTESRYSYSINFQPSDDSNRKGVGIEKMFKNIISIQLMKIIIGQDNTPLPFDSRIYLGLQSYPFLVLHIDEIDGVYHGSNDNLDKAFAHLVFDKEYKCNILTSGQISQETSDIGNNGTVNTVFEKQYTRGFMGYIPIGLEKKVFYPAPLASLNKMTIRLRTPDGEEVNTLRDNLDITSLAIEDIADLQLKKPGGFPKENSKNIKITSTQYFSNRNFRIGDKIVIENYDLVTPNVYQSEFISFINRKRGHHIINLALEVSTNSEGNENEGFINVIYISPPGDYLDTDGTAQNTITGLVDDSFLAGANIPTSDYNPRLLNLSLQNQLIFKITTRDQDTNSVMNIVNT